MFSIQTEMLQKTDRLTVGAATSTILAEAYIQNMEQKQTQY
jgi:hypothetical protein